MNRVSTLQHPARGLRGLARFASVLVFAVVLSSCESTGGGFSSMSGEGRAERQSQNGDHAGAAASYIDLAAAQVGLERDRLTLLAVEQWLLAGDTSRASNAFATVSRPSIPRSQHLWDSNSAMLKLYAGDADGALEILETLSREPLTRKRRLSVDALRADAWIQKEDPARAIELMTQREAMLSSRTDVENNRQHLWRGLLTSDPSILRASAELTLDENTRGWLSLSSLARSTGQQGIGWTNGALRWQSMHAGHPAMTIVEQLDLPDELILDYPKKIALLLPLSGRAERAGRAVQNGFMGAYFSSLESLDEAQSIRVYDVTAEGGASAAYSSAVADGADFVIGPLLKNNVVELASDILVPVPVLTLNYLPDEILAPPGLYQFALAPEDEARSAAFRAISDGHSRSVALVPNNDWGRRVLSAFATEYEALGGTLLDYRSYTPSNPDFSNTIEDLMALSGSVQRYRRLRANLGGALQFDPRRRQDAEFIFLAADAATGRLLKSQLKFHYSGDIPAYSTSSIYERDGRSNSDLNGIMFADAPWQIAPQVWIQQLPELYAEQFPDERRLGRLHAMGYDAYQLIAALYTSHTGDMLEFDGATGNLFLDGDGRVHRRLAWAQFQGGQPVPLPDPEPIGGPIQDMSDTPEVQEPSSADDESWYKQTTEL